MRYALLFPGQGSQEVGMLGALAAEHPVIDDTLREASAVLGRDLLDLIRNGPAEELNRTQRTQPALLAASVAVARLWQAQGLPKPVALAGHSLGEYSALVVARSLDFADALKLVELRGELMQAAVPQGVGAMAAVIGVDDEVVEKACAAYDGDGVLEPANYNAPGQVVVAGSKPAVDWLVANAKTFGIRKVMPIPVSVPSHCSMMRGAARQLGERLLQVAIRAPEIPVLHNLDGASRANPDDIRTALIEQLYRPVRWVQTIRQLEADSVGAFLECGPGKVLATINKRIVNVAPGAVASIAIGDLEGYAQGKQLFTAETEQA
ncbi:MAG: [acyl-carrier-protein] S-malonyltransferase [Xanthomonadaceae bacterium]|nr:[acyl-carrier-protein] S-malonyltransferase [Xanthomonadaceae bacterium]